MRGKKGVYLVYVCACVYWAACVHVCGWVGVSWESECPLWEHKVCVPIVKCVLEWEWERDGGKNHLMTNEMGHASPTASSIPRIREELKKFFSFKYFISLSLSLSLSRAHNKTNSIISTPFQHFILRACATLSLPLSFRFLKYQSHFYCELPIHWITPNISFGWNFYKSFCKKNDLSWKTNLGKRAFTAGHFGIRSVLFGLRDIHIVSQK